MEDLIDLYNNMSPPPVAFKEGIAIQPPIELDYIVHVFTFDHDAQEVRREVIAVYDNRDGWGEDEELSDEVFGPEVYAAFKESFEAEPIFTVKDGCQENSDCKNAYTWRTLHMDYSYGVLDQELRVGVVGTHKDFHLSDSFFLQLIEYYDDSEAPREYY
ncbi:MAG: hypothetical protein OCD01_14250 [Fibrobacterales bacterium]